MSQNTFLKEGTTLQGIKYVIRKKLGQGGFGITYEGEQVLLGKRVVLKECFLNGVCDREDDEKSVFVLRSNREFFMKQKKRFLDEARRLAQLSNPHIVQVYDLFEENGTAYYVMDFIDGKNLADLLSLSGRPFNESMVMEILEQMLDALNCIHNQRPQLCHLDIKPANIMLGYGNRTVLVDFGASKYVSTYDEEKSSSTSIAYTPGYAPIEQLAGIRADMGPWTDFYALGATLFNLLTGKKPANPSAINNDSTPDKSDSIPLPPSVSPRMRQLVVWMMTPNQNGRPQSVEEILRFLGKSSGEKLEDDNSSATILDETTEVKIDGFFSGVKEEETSIEMGDESFVGEAMGKLYSYSREEIEQYGISVISISHGHGVTIYYRGYTYECDVDLVSKLRSFSDVESSMRLFKASLRVKDGRRTDLVTYLNGNRDTIAHAFNMITFCSESDLFEIFRLQQSPSVFGDYRIEMEMQLIPLCFDANEDCAYSFEYQCQYCDVLQGGSVAEIYQSGFIGERKNNFAEWVFVENEPVVKKLSAFEGFASLVLGAIIQYNIFNHYLTDETVLLSMFPFDINAEIWINGSYRDAFNLMESMTTIPFKKTYPIKDDNCSSIVIVFLGKRFKIDVQELFGYTPKSLKILCDVNLSHRIKYILIDVKQGKEVSILQTELLNHEI